MLVGGSNGSVANRALEARESAVQTGEVRREFRAIAGG
jgi:hypothetical protein